MAQDEETRNDETRNDETRNDETQTGETQTGETADTERPRRSGTKAQARGLQFPSMTAPELAS